MKKIKLPLYVSVIIMALLSCNNQKTEKGINPVVSVKTEKVIQGDIESLINLNGQTVYLTKNEIVSPIAGYVIKVNVRFGDYVHKDDVLFEIKNKESKALENSDLFSGNVGVVKVLASSEGLIYNLPVSNVGGYIIEGGTLCSIVENKDLIIKVNMPFEYNQKIKLNAKCKVLLIDNTSFEGYVYKILSNINELNQTQDVLIKSCSERQLPENLNLIVQFVDSNHKNSCLVSKNAVMTDETQSEFWVMKISDDSIAIKTPIVKGITNDSIVEILSSGLKKGDLIITEGAYGLPDSSLVKIVR